MIVKHILIIKKMNTLVIEIEIMKLHVGLM